MTLDLAKSEVKFGERTVELTRNEFKILRLLMENCDTIISRQELMNESSALAVGRVHRRQHADRQTCNRLRKSLEKAGVTDYLITRRGQGYLV